MFGKKKALKVTMIDDNNADGVGYTPYPDSRPPIIDLSPYAVEEMSKSVVKAYAAIKVVETLCGVAVHVVLTKVK